MAPRIFTGASPERGGTAMRFFPQINFMPPLSMIDRPMVRKIKTRWF